MSAVRDLQNLYATAHRLNRPDILALDIFKDGFNVTRQQRIQELIGIFERYVFKDVYKNSALHFCLPDELQQRRLVGDLYRPHIIGQVYRRTIMYNDNPLGYEGRGHKCICLQIKCPDDAGAEVREFYQRQVMQLFFISAEIASENNGCIYSSWLIGDRESDLLSTMIKVMLPRRSRANMDLEDNCYVDLTVNMSVNKGVDQVGKHINLFKLWYCTYIPLTRTAIRD